MTSIKKILGSSSILVVESISNKLVGLISTIVLARVLLPEDFGIVAVALLIIGFFDVISQTGMNQYLLRSKRLDDQIINTSWTINFIIKTILCFIIVALAPVITNYYDDARLLLLLVALSSFLILGALKNPGLVYLERNQNYGPIVKATLFSKLLAVGASIFIAVVYQSYWALVVGTAVNKLSMLYFGYRIKRFRLKFQLVNAREQWRFSGWVIPQSILGYFRTQFDTLLVSSSFGKDALGSYHVMKYLSFMPSEYIMGPATKPLLAELALVKNQVNKLRNQFDITFLVTLIIAMPITAMMFLYREDIVWLFLGKNWLPFSELFGLLAGLVLSTVMYQQAGRILMVMGNTRLLFIYEATSFVCIYLYLFIVVGLTNLEVFTANRVVLEIFFSSLFLLYVTTLLFNYKAAASLICSLFIVFFISIPPTILSLLISGNLQLESPFLRLIVSCTVFASIYTLLVFGTAVVMKKHSPNWAAINFLIVKLVNILR